MICKNYFPFYRLSFHFLIVTFKAQHFLILMMPIIYFFPSACAFAVNFTKILHQYFLQEYNSFITSLNYLLCWVLAAAHRILSLQCNMQGLLVAVCGLLSCSMHVGSSSPTRDWTQAPCIGTVDSYPLDHHGKSLSLNFSLWLILN